MKKCLALFLSVATLLTAAACNTGNAEQYHSMHIKEMTTEFEYGDSFLFDGKVSLVSDKSEKQLKDTEYTVDASTYNPFQLGEQTVSVSSGALTVEYTVNVVKAKKLRYLIIGNSYSDDTNRYMQYVAESAGLQKEDLVIANLYRGGCSLDTHFSKAGQTYYFYREWVSGEGVNYTSDKADKENYHAYTSTLLGGVTAQPWDYIIFQQASIDSGMASTYSHLQDLIDYVKPHVTNPNVKFGWNMTWAYSTDYVNFYYNSRYGSNQGTMYASIAQTVQETVLKNENILFLSPAGTAIQNARSSYLGDTLNRDGTHLSLDLGCTISAMTMFCTLTGYTPEEIGLCYPVEDEKRMAIAVESVSNALKNPYQVTQSQYVTKN